MLCFLISRKTIWRYMAFEYRTEFQIAEYEKRKPQAMEIEYRFIGSV